jgi:peptide/nickel transport system permease protein
MFKLIFKRIVTSLFVMFGLVTLTFVIIRLAPGDPAAMYLSPEVNPEIAVQIRENFGLNEPIHRQYFKWLGVLPPFEGLLQGDFGYSFMRHKPVKEVINEAIPNTLLLTLSALALNFIIGISLGIYSAYRANKKSDKIISTVSVALYSMPEFWVSLLLIIVFSLTLGWLPSSQMHSNGYESLSGFGNFLDVLKHLALPLIVLGVCSSATTIKYMRGSVLDILKKDYILYAKMKGLSAKDIFFKHVFRNSLNPIFTLFGLYFPFILGSSAIVEYVFALPGIGRITIDSIFARDYPVIIATTFITGLLVTVGNMIADILVMINDPRTRKAE